MSDLNLDDPGTYTALDPDDMYRRINDFPDQIAQAWELSRSVELPDEYRSVSSVVITGMGGSAIGGSLLASYGSPELPVPVVVWRGYGLPALVSADTLVIAASYSGNTEETLSALEAARARGARLLAVTTGGRVGALADEWKIPSIRFSYEAQPRATLGYLFTPLLAVFQRLGFLTVQDDEVSESIAIARQAREEYGGDAPLAGNAAKQLAEACRGSMVVAYGAEYLAEVAHRWKTQMNENAKNWSFWEEFSELNHNAIVGYECPPDVVERVLVILLRGSHLSPRITRRIEVTERILNEHGVPHRAAEARGRGRLAQMISLIALGDYVSYYLALLNGVDPTIIQPIDYLKGELAR